MAQTVAVTAVADGDREDETITVRHSASGGGFDNVTGMVQITVTDTTQDEAKEEAKVVLNQVVLPNLLQQLTAETTEVITSRLNAIASGSRPNALPALSLESVVEETVAALYGERQHLKNGSLDWRQTISGRDFVLPLPLPSLNPDQEEEANTQDNPFSTLALWGGGNYSNYRNIVANTDIDGNGFSGVIGMDLQPIPRLVTGLALTTSRWKLDYATNIATNDAHVEGTYKIGITMVNPYLSWLAMDQLSFWAAVGYGRGEVEQTLDEENISTRTGDLTSWAGGIRFAAIPPIDSCTGIPRLLGLAFKVDSTISNFLDTQVQLARLAAEVSRSFPMENGLLTAALDLGWRIRSVSHQGALNPLQERITDRNHTSGGAELAGSLNWRHTDGSVSATVEPRVFLGGDDHREWGMAATSSWRRPGGMEKA